MAAAPSASAAVHAVAQPGSSPDLDPQRGASPAISARWFQTTILQPLVLPYLRRWADEERLPWHAVSPPPELADFASRFRTTAGRALLPRLAILQHDEKDIYRVLGRNGLQDWGDGVPQELVRVLEDLEASAAARVRQLALLPSSASPPPGEELARCAAALQRISRELLRASAAVKARSALLKAKSDKLQRKLEKLPAGSERRRLAFQKHIQFNLYATSEGELLSTRVGVLCGKVDGIPSAPAATHSASVLRALLEDASVLLNRAFELEHVAASKALACCLCSVFECPSWGLGSIFFTVDDAKTWQIREAVHRSVASSVESGLLPVIVGADKAYISAAHWDRAGYALTRSAAKREVLYVLSRVPVKGGLTDVSVDKWPRVADLRSEAEQLLARPGAAASGVVREAWMDDFYKSRTRERWRDWLRSHGIKSLRVSLPRLDTLANAGHLQRDLEVVVPLKDVLKEGLLEAARARQLVGPAESLNVEPLRERLVSGGIDTCSARLMQLRKSVLKKLPGACGALGRLQVG